MNVSNRAQQLTPSVTLATAKSESIKSKRCRCFKLNGWGTRFCNPEYSKATIASIEDGRASYYTPSGGIPELKQAIVSYMWNENINFVINPSKLL